MNKKEKQILLVLFIIDFFLWTWSFLLINEILSMSMFGIEGFAREELVIALIFTLIPAVIIFSVLIGCFLGFKNIKI